MAKYVGIALTNPAEGKEAEFNDWYDNQHTGRSRAARMPVRPAVQTGRPSAAESTNALSLSGGLRV